MDERFVQSEGTNVYTGCELIIKGGLESGVGLLTGYPGSPIAEVFDTATRLQELYKQEGIVVQIANNEALGGARLNGSQMAQVRGMGVMKSVGMHVASDTLMISSMAGTTAGAVVVVGDDPWNSSTQVAADSRFLSKHLFMPIMEPSTFQELKDWVELAYQLSAEANLYITYLITTNQADGGGSVELQRNIYPELNEHAKTTLESDSIVPDERILLPPVTGLVEKEIRETRFPRLLEGVRQRELNRILYPGTAKKLGFITSGLAYCYLEHALHELGVPGSVPILKLGLTYPIDPEILETFANQVDQVVVIEERRSFVESQVKEILTDLHQTGRLEQATPIWGKLFPFGLPGIPDTSGLNPSLLIHHLAPLLEQVGDPAITIEPERFQREYALATPSVSKRSDIPLRTPTFCPGCPHRDSASVLKQVADDFRDADYMQQRHQHGPVDLIFHGDIGCYSMLKFAPYERLMHNLGAMALGGGGVGAGIAPFITNKQMVFMGDSTFFHGGMSAISDSIKHGQDITYVILDNRTTAMTGHQPTPANDVTVVGESSYEQNIDKILEGLTDQGDILLIRTNPEKREEYKRLLETTILKDGVKLIIADKECAITYQRQLRRENRQIIKEHGFLPQETFININTDVCEYCQECTIGTGCPGLTITDTAYGPKITTSLSACISDGACARIKACPSFEEVTVTRTKAPVRAFDDTLLDDLPQPPRFMFQDNWHLYSAGVGGMGIGSLGAVLVRAGYRQGYRVLYCDKKGLAIRNGGVYHYLTYTHTDTPLSPVYPQRKADLLIGLDLLESARAVDEGGPTRVASADRTATVVNTARTDTVNMLLGKDDFEPEKYELLLIENSRDGGYYALDMFEVCERLLGNKLYANSMILGVAFQRGWLPLELESIEWAMKHSWGPALDMNMRAFHLGRKLVVAPEELLPNDTVLELDQLIHQKKLALTKARGRSKKKAQRQAQQYECLVHSSLEPMEISEQPKRYFALGIYDLIQYDSVAYAQRYAELVLQVYSQDLDARGYEATEATIRYLHKVMLIKDEVYVAHLLTSEEKYARDRERYGIAPERGDKVNYVHVNRPHFDVLGKRIEFDIRTKDWQLRLMRRTKFLRGLLSGWHTKEREFRDWYIRDVVMNFDGSKEPRYDAHVEALRLPEQVRGYREIRYPKMEEARRKARQLLG